MLADGPQTVTTRLLPIFAALMFGFTPAGLPAASPASEPWQPETRRRVTGDRRVTDTSTGQSVRAGNCNGEVVYQRQFSHRYIDPVDPSKSRLANDETLYRVASISKLITTLGVMRLVEAGKLRLDDDVSPALGFSLRNPAFPDVPITLRTLLNHTSSLRDDAGYYWDAGQNVHLRDVLVPGGHLHGDGAMWDKQHAPGTYFQYCNLAWGVISGIMERATGERFDRLMKRLVLDPLGLRGGFHPFDLSEADLQNVATLYRKALNGCWAGDLEPSGPWIAQVDDYVKERPVARAAADYVPGSNGTRLVRKAIAGCRQRVSAA